MGKHKNKKRGLSDKREKNRREIITRDDFFNYVFPQKHLEVVYPTKEEQDEFKAYFFARHELLYDEDERDPLKALERDEQKKYEKKRKKLLNKEASNFNEAFINLGLLPSRLEKLEKKYNKHTRKMKYDMSVASLLNTKSYRKCYFSNDEYRKELKKIAKQENDDIKEGIKQGYIHSNKDMDEEIEKLEKLINTNQYLTKAIGDSYVQKYFID